MSKVMTEQELELSFDGKIPGYRKPDPDQPTPVYIVHYGDGLTEEFTSWLACTNWLQNEMYMNGGKIDVTLIRTVW